ncbi:hypothetical protein GCM10023237_16480 [Streptomyces coeruleoprunus]
MADAYARAPFRLPPGRRGGGTRGGGGPEAMSAADNDTSPITPDRRMPSPLPRT